MSLASLGYDNLYCSKIWGKFVKPGEVVLDIGAYIGWVSLVFAYLGAKVYAIEGSANNTVKLKEVVEGLDVVVFNVALSNINKSCITRFNDCNGFAHLEQPITYRIYDEFAKEQNIPDPSFVKVDIEGMETLALHGMRCLLEKVRPVWHIEYHHNFPFKYPDYPGFVSVADGGFDFDEFNRLDYVILNNRLKVVKGLRPSSEHAADYFMVPAEKSYEIQDL